MKKIVQAWFFVALSIMLAACAGTPKIAFKSELKQNIHKIALIEITEPATYSLYPGTLGGGSSLYMLGALGGAILGGIEAGRQEFATAKFTSLVKPLKPDLSSVAMLYIDQGLTANGYIVTRVPAPASDNSGLDLSKIDAEQDTVLVTSLFAGYRVISAVVPHVSITVTLYSRKGGSKLFSDVYLYSTSGTGQMVFVPSDSKYTFNSVETLYSNPKLAVEGLRAGAEQVARRFVADLY